MNQRARRGGLEVTQAADGKWHGWLDLGQDSNTGSRRRKHVAHPNRRIAQARLELMQRQLVRRGADFVAAPKPKSVAEWFERWLDEDVRWRGPSRIKAARERAVRESIGPVLGATRLSRLMQADVVALLEGLPSYEAKRNCLETVFTALEAARDCGFVDLNVAIDISVGRLTTSRFDMDDQFLIVQVVDPGTVHVHVEEWWAR